MTIQNTHAEFFPRKITTGPPDGSTFKGRFLRNEKGGRTVPNDDLRCRKALDETDLFSVTLFGTERFVFAVFVEILGSKPSQGVCVCVRVKYSAK